MVGGKLFNGRWKACWKLAIGNQIWSESWSLNNHWKLKDIWSGRHLDDDASISRKYLMPQVDYSSNTRNLFSGILTKLGVYQLFYPLYMKYVFFFWHMLKFLGEVPGGLIGSIHIIGRNIRRYVYNWQKYWVMPILKRIECSFCFLRKLWLFNILNK